MFTDTPSGMDQNYEPGKDFENKLVEDGVATQVEIDGDRDAHLGVFMARQQLEKAGESEQEAITEPVAEPVAEPVVEAAAVEDVAEVAPMAAAEAATQVEEEGGELSEQDKELLSGIETKVLTRLEESMASHMQELEDKVHTGVKDITGNALSFRSQKYLDQLVCKKLFESRYKGADLD